MNTKTFIIEFARILVGNAWNRTGSVLTILGASALTGWVDQVVGALLHINITQTATWIGFAVMVTGIAMLAYAKAWPRSDFLAMVQHDIDLLKQYRQLIPPSLVRFLTVHSFRTAFRKDRLSPLEVISDDWNTGHYKFVDAEVQAALTETRKHAKAFMDLGDKKLFTDRDNPNLFSPLTDPDRDQGITAETRVSIAELNALARKLAEAFNAFERVAHQKIG
ncbi:hypothetical protein [Bradyrhizobium sp. AUGA SZCCT0042]|uniref:hypothetical protein n=1 Tax=Bradyrhizobium sp. AUGA SZCCT0042 TaxID=2807651 RepID=UPI001BA9E444|nr:hypothetical protein [Bradyrhizobium sp. AUGA SZCCT0042]MBR1296639.1 hypothetical protein [Bradyrhizobium sp. AUGA SZCCT0042]